MMTCDACLTAGPPPERSPEELNALSIPELAALYDHDCQGPDVEAIEAGYAQFWIDHPDIAAAVASGDPSLVDKRAAREHRAPDMSPEAVAARREAKIRAAEAMAYVTAYVGSWGLPLDIRADRRWGTNHMRLTEKQVDALLAGKARDLAHAAELLDPRQEAARTFLSTIARPREGFEADMVTMAASARPMSPGQLGAVERWREREEATRAQSTAPAPSGLAAQSPTGPGVGSVAAGMYRDPVEGTIYRVQPSRSSGRLYAMRLVEGDTGGDFEYAPGAMARILPAWRMTADEAAAFGRAHGWCCVCGRLLTNPVSIAAGIGPICGGRI
jgi:Family of unknown function (DUF6011)